MQKENGVLENLESLRSYSYSIWPTSFATKSQIEMKFYQKPIYNFKLECEINPETSMQAVQDIIDGQLNGGKASNRMLKWFADTCITIVVLVITLTIISCPAIVIVGPLMQIFASGMFIKSVILIDAALEEINADVDDFDMNMQWINQCVDGNFHIDFDSLASAREKKLEVASDVGTIRSLMITQLVCMGIFLLTILCTGVVILLLECIGGNGNISRNCGGFKYEFNYFLFKGFKIFN